MVETLKSSDQDDLVPGFGAMGLSSALGRSLSYEEAEPVLLKALQFGCTFWDTAVSHANGVNEKLLGDSIRKHDCRDRVFLASKCGVAVFEDEAINSASHIQTHIDGTIDRLGFAPDLYYLHRIDRSTTLQESISALDSIRKADKTKYIGLSECSAATLREADSIAKIDAFLAEYSAFETFHKHDNGLVDTCRELNVAFQLTAPWVTVGWSTSTTSPTNHQVTPNKMSTEDRSPSP